MLKERILATLRFFDLQDYPLTLLELEKFLIVDSTDLIRITDHQGELNSNQGLSKLTFDMGQVLQCLDTQCPEVENHLGFYFLKGRKHIVDLRLRNYFYGIEREKNIHRYAKILKYIPFVRGAALAGSQAMGQQKESSDIDLLIIIEGGYLWLARTLVTGYFQLIGKRRYGNRIKDRFCLNHYLVGPKEINKLRNLYTASEYLKLRPLVYEHVIWAFETNNKWLLALFPNFTLPEPPKEKQNSTQKILEAIFNNGFGRLLNAILKSWQLPKIRQERFIVVEEDELSFHPDSKQESLLGKFSGFSKL